MSNDNPQYPIQLITPLLTANASQREKRNSAMCDGGLGGEPPQYWQQREQRENDFSPSLARPNAALNAPQRNAMQRDANRCKAKSTLSLSVSLYSRERKGKERTG